MGKDRKGCCGALLAFFNTLSASMLQGHLTGGVKRAIMPAGVRAKAMHGWIELKGQGGSG
jgi:hypothetical protein